MICDWDRVLVQHRLNSLKDITWYVCLLSRR